MKVGDLIKFKTGYLATILSVGPGLFGDDHMTIWIHGIVNIKNPTYMNMATLQLNSEVISECR